MHSVNNQVLREKLELYQFYNTAILYLSQSDLAQLKYQT